MKKLYLSTEFALPILKSGTNYMDLMSYQLGQFAIKGLLDRTGN